MHAYYYNEHTGEDKCGAHQFTPPRPVTAEQLGRIGVLYWRLNESDRMAKLEAICKERDYKNRDEVRAAVVEAVANLLVHRHLHEDEEIRFILDGSGYFDVRDNNDEWIRIFMERGDLIVLPAGIYHRFALDEHQYVHTMRLFKDEPKWAAVYRPADDNPCRVAYVQSLSAAS
ncbi:1,2-dihydroxy-3-keto-5-methylthiopentene dioxygenase 3 [Syncephalis pseudoplumigaleata]|uniref:Acireductone dioxygenase n=1 Tax=Syncephalis pseudoplumigaleata TaxID=1712513 RepID=A0A4P9Z4B3_9FUNG|nr:1,2-dihydroxy-3-keto-5-methylthiopentene dioxygenase 3 [Syncephalis pseudoplumigaleata]|eukprot:RKP27336.1 1,2-dihydroxy-3-keto-5-methylthiopentene dioxygenase 3 [Syncephalis pseudoplumigaleata]